ncbi:MAG: glycosyltransferase family 39 protein [Gemmatimonadaceae bacterium]
MTVADIGARLDDAQLRVRQPEVGERSHPRSAAWLAATVIAIGLGLRVVQYAARRSLWHDEAMISLNVVSRSFLGMLDRLDYNQSAPVLFLWGQWLLTRVAGVNELALRALPLLAGIALLVVFWRFAARLVGLEAALVALALAALSPMFIYFSNEAKPYILDALITVVLLRLALDVVETPEPGRPWWRLIGAGAGALLASTPSLFVLAGVGASLASSRRVRTARAGWIRLGLAAAVWLGSFAVIYLALLRPVAVSDYMQLYWAPDFLPLAFPEMFTHSARVARGVVIGALFGAEDAVRLPPRTLFVVLLVSVVGAVALVRRRGWWVLVLLGGPAAATAGASLLHQWPLIARLLLFLVPAFLILFATGLATLATLVSKQFRVVALASTVALVLFPAGRRAVRDAASPVVRQDSRPVIAEFMRRHHPGAAIYVSHSIEPAWTFYTTRWGSSRQSLIEREIARRGDVGRNQSAQGCAVHPCDARVVRGSLMPARWGDSSATARAAMDRWADSEVARIKAASAPETWLLFIPYNDPARGERQRIKARMGGEPGFSRAADMVRLEAYYFTAPPTRGMPAGHKTTGP